MIYAKLVDGQLITAHAPEHDPETNAMILNDGFKPYDDSARPPELGSFQAAHAAYQEESDMIYLYWEIVDDSPEKLNEQIAVLEKELSSTDYKVIKSYEYELAGQVVPYNVEALHAERQMLRDTIRQLELRLVQ